jgi:hypothetical protein
VIAGCVTPALRRSHLALASPGLKKTRLTPRKWTESTRGTVRNKTMVAASLVNCRSLCINDFPMNELSTALVTSQDPVDQRSIVGGGRGQQEAEAKKGDRGATGRQQSTPRGPGRP